MGILSQLQSSRRHAPHHKVCVVVKQTADIIILKFNAKSLKQYNLTERVDFVTEMVKDGIAAQNFASFFRVLQFFGVGCNRDNQGWFPFAFHQKEFHL